MNETAPATAESSLLLWMLAAVVAMLAAHVGLGWVREAQRKPGLRQSWLALLIASGALGSGICAAIVLAMSAQALTFPLGYRIDAAPVLWLLATLGCLPVTVWLRISQRPAALIGAGVLLAALAAGIQAGWVWAADLRPGIIWHIEWVVVAVSLIVVGVVNAMWLAFSSIGQEGRSRQYWRLGAAVLLGLSLIAGQELLLAAAGLLTQISSISADDLPASVLCLVVGGALPLLLSVMAVDLEMRRRPLGARRRRRRRRHRNHLA